MKHQFTAIIQRGEKYLIATSPEVPEAHGQGLTREECLRDLAGSIQSVLEYRREETRANLKTGFEETVVEVA
ncbi:MAG TPA: type II toxin-antitoxin system HicB family antitoxin [Verrucomicrobiae bacterium]|nr:type II toxin-antitoxin system HicB family antitoxin [Verrucomicrobiae bacterium]